MVDHCISLQAFISPSTAAEHFCQTPGTLERNSEINQANVPQLSGVSMETQGLNQSKETRSLLCPLSGFAMGLCGILLSKYN